MSGVPSSEPVVLLLLPGLDGTDAFFSPLRAALPDWVRSTVVPYPQSGPTGYRDLAPLVERAASGLDRFFVLGWSFGGPLALRLAASRPEAVLGVVLAASFVLPPRPELVRWRPATVTPLVWTLRALRRTRYLFPSAKTAELRRAKGETWRRARAGALAARARAALGVDARPDLAACRAPILYLVSESDRSVPPHNARDVLSGSARAELATVPGGHMSIFTHATDVARVIVHFFRRST